MGGVEAHADAIGAAMGAGDRGNHHIIDMKVATEVLLKQMAHSFSEEEAVGVGDDDAVILNVILEFDHVIENFVESADPTDRFADRDHLAVAIHIDDRMHADEAAHRGGDA